MNRVYRSAHLLPAFAVFMAGVAVQAFAETPGEIPKPWTYEGGKKPQEQQRQDQPTSNSNRRRRAIVDRQVEAHQVLLKRMRHDVIG